MHLEKPLSPNRPPTPPTHGPSVEAECMVDDQVFTGINKPHIPQPRKKVDDERHRCWRWCLHENTVRKGMGNHLSTFLKNVASQIRSLMDVIYRRKRNWIGHILRGEAC